MLIDQYCYGNKYYFGSTELWLTDWLLPEGLLRFALNLVGNKYCYGIKYSYWCPNGNAGGTPRNRGYVS